MRGRAHPRALLLAGHRRDAEQVGQLWVRARAGACAMRRPQAEPDLTRGDGETSAAHDGMLRARATAEELWEPPRTGSAALACVPDSITRAESPRGGAQWVFRLRSLLPMTWHGRWTHIQHARTARVRRSTSVAVLISRHDADAWVGRARLLHRVDVPSPRRAGRERVSRDGVALAVHRVGAALPVVKPTCK